MNRRGFLATFAAVPASLASLGWRPKLESFQWIWMDHATGEIADGPLEFRSTVGCKAYVRFAPWRRPNLVGWWVFGSAISHKDRAWYKEHFRVSARHYFKAKGVAFRESDLA